MKVTPSPIVANLHGTSGGAVCFRLRANTYAKRHFKPHNPRSPAQTAQRDAFKTAGAYWRSLPRALQLAYGRGAIPI